jgi:hypothetical protein
MGGNAIKISERIPKKTFWEYTEIIKPKIEKAFDTKVHIVTSYHNKEDFGDLDLLVLENANAKNRHNIVKNVFNPKEVSVNSHIYSFNYKKLQVDLIFTPEENWEASKIFFQHGDLGNFMGKLVNNYGHLADNGIFLKYGYDGFKAKLVYKANAKKIYITKDNKKIFDFLGLDFNQWEKGFNDKFEMFDYVIKSKYYDSSSFQWENLNHINKSRNARRPNYHVFLDYIENHKNIIEWNSDKTEYFNEINSFFGIDLEEEMNIFKDEILQKKLNSEKFNGKIVMGLFPNLKGKELGDTIKAYKESKDDFDAFINENSAEYITENFKEWYGNFR